MKKYLIIIFLVFIIAGCENDPDIVTTQDQTGQVTLSLENLPALNDTVKYVAWLYFSDDSGIDPFKIDVLDFTGGSTSVVLEPNLYYLRRAQELVITVESLAESADTLPGLKVLAGTILANSGNMNVSNLLSLGLNFEEIAGKYTLFTPTDTTDTSPKSGIWFLDYNNGNYAEGLILPELPSGWHYEGWIDIAGKLISTGRFSSTDGLDSSDYDGTHAQIPFPGEDFLFNAPEGFTFPLDLSGAKVFITITANRNFFSSNELKILSADIPGTAESLVTYDMQVNQVFPKGNITIDVNL